VTASRTSEGVSWGEVGVGFATVTFAAIAGWQAGQIPGEGVGSSVGPNVIPWVVSGMLGLFVPHLSSKPYDSEPHRPKMAITPQSTAAARSGCCLDCCSTSP